MAKRQPKEVNHGDGTVTAHELTQTWADKPKLKVANPDTMSELDYRMLFFPSECIDDILCYTNANIRDQRKRVTKGELYKVIGFLYAMTLGVLKQRWDY